MRSEQRPGTCAGGISLNGKQRRGRRLMVALSLEVARGELPSVRARQKHRARPAPGGAQPLHQDERPRLTRAESAAAPSHPCSGDRSLTVAMESSP